MQFCFVYCDLITYQNISFLPVSLTVCHVECSVTDWKHGTVSYEDAPSGKKKTDPNLGTRGQSINLWSIVSKTWLMKVQRTKALVLFSQQWKVDIVSFKIKSWKHRDTEVFVSPGALFVGWMYSQIFTKSKWRVRPCGACMCLWVQMNQMRGMIPSAYLWADLQMLEVGSCLPLEKLNWNVDTHTREHTHLPLNSYWDSDCPHWHVLMWRLYLCALIEHWMNYRSK